MKTKLVSLVLIFSLLLTGITFAGAAQEETEIDFWYALSGTIAETTLELVEGFNETHPNIHVNAVNKGTYSEALTSAVAAYRSGNAPDIVQVYEVGTQTMLDSGAVHPLWKLVEEYDLNIDTENFIAPVKSYFEVDGKLASLPFNSSTPVMYYNKDAFEEAGLNPNHPPRTFAEVEEMGKQLINNTDVKYALTAGWPSWTLLENMHTWHRQPIANNNNGYSDYATELKVNQDFSVELFETYRNWQQENVFTYQGREGSPNPSFLGGDIGMIITSTAYLSGFKEAAEFEIGTTYLPHMQGYPRGNSLIGGATLWALKGNSEEEQEATAKFLEYVARTDNQVFWHKNTGYFPVTNSAVRRLLDEGWFADNPNYLTAFLQMSTGVTTEGNKGLRLGNFVSIRNVLLNQIESMFGGDRTPERALNRAVREVNGVLDNYVSSQE